MHLNVQPLPSRSPRLKASGSLREFLLEVGLSWPVKGRSTRQQLLESLVTLSLDFGMPALWNIVAGRHLLVPTQNTLYMSLDSRFHEWSADVQLLGRKGNLLKYLRRCAEVVGGKGESYSGMITDVLTTHVQLAKIVKVRDSGVSFQSNGLALKSC
ncbi:hypothetical protein HPB48_000878 [Haemaphysalis longicornis]|uniref:Uncharacterized protein n=1 Tax=Haemaphysalis longicornis TaxID=44386 RepID=A0A9J6GT57_HAELO|nr:hypothetical protein HPB48_000878 [Haemaphysalis longicornis]